MQYQNYINHIALVLDASGSMTHLAKEVVTVADNRIKYLAQRSRELDQETRVSIYTFEGRTIRCLIFDKDVLRMPSIRGMYVLGGDTPLIDATLKSLDDLNKTAILYGEHAFLVYVLTDGQENASKAAPLVLQGRLAGLPDNWTVALFVPDQQGVFNAKAFGFPKDNIAVWTTTEEGIVEAGNVIDRASERFMMGRTAGVRGYKNLFKLDTTTLSTQTVKGLDKLTPGQFRILPVDYDQPIAEYVETHLRRPYLLGEGYYQLTKPVTVQPHKKVALYEKGKHTVYTGVGARALLGLPSEREVRVEPARHPLFDIFIQSTSTNRKLLSGTYLLLLS